ncbi:hypothetical protein [Fodinibius halophilus]|uniref:Flagellar assembly protein FliH/Type III secretion system HrpE domain-containing protein n=1 Tax=Fodinibius halophilus TaxID=1736908 RepID=A0A6M1TAN0_9BACT|nr:hypothetical protein [Fodinibius halophilus]NGP87402.1 hypothetical protein [Fodinibius halophilus]
MEDQKIFNTDQVSWYEDDDNQLDYQVAFEEAESFKTDPLVQEGVNETDEPQQQQVDVKELLRERDQKWKERIKKSRAAAFSKGVEQGKQQGYEQAEKEFKQKEQQLEMMFEKAHMEWHARHEALNPGLLDLVFEIVEEIVGLPVENPAIRESLEEELSVLLHGAEEEIKPLVRVSESDYKFVEELVEKYAPEATLTIRVSEDCNPGEFEFETDKKMVVYRFKEMLNDFRENLSLPSWK